MLDELKELIKLIAELPSMALWILAGFAIYKTFVFSSVTASLYYGFKFAVEKIHDWKVRPKETQWKIYENDTYMVIQDAKEQMTDAFNRAIQRCRRENGFIHLDDARPIIESLNDVKPRKKD